MIPRRRGIRVPAKWRPPLALVIASVLGIVIVLPAAAMLVLRVHETTLVQAAGRAEVVAGGLVGGLVLAVVAGLIIHRAVTRPVKALIQRTRAIANGDRGALRPLDQHGTAEFAELSQSLLDMAGGLARRSDVVGGFAAHVSHELKSPLTSMRAAAELLRDDLAEEAQSLSREDRERLLGTIIAEAGRLHLLLQRLRDLARAEAPAAPGQTMLSAVLPGLRASHPGLALDTGSTDEAPIPIAADTVAIVLGHLLDNAVRHGATTVTIGCTRSPQEVTLSVRDDGPGIAAGNRERIFDAFFTTRRGEGGTGMGLAIVRALLEAQGGTISLVDGDGGALFRIVLPQPQPASSKIWPPS